MLLFFMFFVAMNSQLDNKLNNQQQQTNTGEQQQIFTPQQTTSTNTYNPLFNRGLPMKEQANETKANLKNISKLNLSSVFSKVMNGFNQIMYKNSKDKAINENINDILLFLTIVGLVTTLTINKTYLFEAALMLITIGFLIKLFSILCDTEEWQQYAFYSSFFGLLCSPGVAQIILKIFLILYLTAKESIYITNLEMETVLYLSFFGVFLLCLDEIWQIIIMALVVLLIHKVYSMSKVVPNLLGQGQNTNRENIIQQKKQQDSEIIKTDNVIPNLENDKN